jgi:hypothetical protein
MEPIGGPQGAGGLGEGVGAGRSGKGGIVRDRILRRLERIVPGWVRGLSDRPELEVPAFGVSVLTHLLVLLAFGMIGYAAHTERVAEFRTEVIDTALPDLERIETSETELNQIDQPQTLVPTAGSFAPTVAPIVVAPTSQPPSPPQELNRMAVARISDISLPMAARLDQSVSIKGSGSEHVGAVEGAVDRIAVEIMRRLEKGKTLVVWAFDASGSLVAERQRLGKHIEKVYEDLLKLDNQSLARDDGLLTAVVAFGQSRKLMTPKPTSELAAITSAIAEVPIDTTGVENTFSTVLEIVHKYGKFRGKGNERYQTMIIVVTDEVGDDESYLEEAIAAAVAAKVPVFVLGSPALFCRVEGYADYTDPKTGRTYHHLPVRQGPDGAMLEQIHLPFWYEGPQYDLLDSGFGPYALSRLAGATGGIYFVTRMGPNRITFDPVGMREYKPDWVSRAQYEAAVERHPLRKAVLQAAMITQQNLPGQPGLTFPPADTPAFKEEMRKQQEIVARIAYTVDAALEPIAAVAKLRDREPSRRWQAHYDLIRGRLITMKVRCYEYNWACAQMKKDTPKFQKPGSNAWRLVPDEKIHYNEKAAAAGKEARALLKRVVEDHPGTPWALLAQRELKDPLGFKWVEVSIPPPPKPKDAGAAGKMKKNNNPAPKPEEPPKL